MTKAEIIQEINRKKSFLCIGLDTDINKIPPHLRIFDDPVFEFNKQIIDVTKKYTVAYKINTAFYESQGVKGWKSLEKTLNYIPNDIFKIADAKRGDIGNTADHYAKTFFETFPFDAVTLNPYMGVDTIAPFLKYKSKWVIILALTSNQGAEDFEMIQVGDRKLFEEVIEKSSQLAGDDQIMYVAGATRHECIKNIREIAPDNFLLVPGVGVQGGSLEKICEYGLNKDIGLLVNASRSVIYSSIDESFTISAEKEVINLQQDMECILTKSDIFDKKLKGKF